MQALWYNLVVGQKAIYALPAEIRSRLNALYLCNLFSRLRVSIGAERLCRHARRRRCLQCHRTWICRLSHSQLFVTEFRAATRQVIIWIQTRRGIRLGPQLSSTSVSGLNWPDAMRLSP